MAWNWQKVDWPNFSYDRAQLEEFEAQFLYGSGSLFGALKHLGEEERNQLTIEIISNEALKSSEIEGEYLDRESLQSSLRRHFGLQTDDRKIAPAEQGIAELMNDLYRTSRESLTHATLFVWHTMLMTGRHDLKDVGRYRTHAEPMQIVSGSMVDSNVYFEAPPSAQMAQEMDQFIAWFNRTAPDGATPLPALTRASIAHLYFVSIHPFEDGNGRIGRAIAEKVLSQAFGQPTLIALAHMIEKQKKAYYSALEQANKNNTITPWLLYFAQTILAAQHYTQQWVEFLIEKTKLYDRVRGQFNSRQMKALARLFREGPEGFAGGLSAANYISITKTPRATATRDLQDMVDKGALFRTGTLKSTRYYLNIPRSLAKNLKL